MINGKNMLNKNINTFIIATLFLLWIGLCLALLSNISINNLPTLYSVCYRLIKDLYTIDYKIAMLQSLKRVFIGFVFGGIIAIPLAILTTQYKKIKIIILPLIELLRPIPNVAWVPISIIIFTNANHSIYFLTFLSAFFPIFTGIKTGMENIPYEYKVIADNLGVNKATYILEILLPYSLKSLFSSLHLGINGSWLAVIMAEMINWKDGIGYITWKCYTLIDYEGVISGMLVIGFLGSLSYIFLKSISKSFIFIEKEK